MPRRLGRRHILFGPMGEWGNKKIKKWFCRDLIQGRQGVIIEASSEVFIFSLLPVDKVCNSVDLLGEEMVDGDLQ